MQKIVETITENSTIEGKSSIEFDENAQLFFAHNNYFSLQNIFSLSLLLLHCDTEA